MVRFFNQKEEVINIELTPYGRQQFASGTFAPAHYAFYDTSIIYDGEYANITETQNQVTNRITNETPRLLPQTRFSSNPGSVYSLLTSNTENEFFQNVSSSAPFARALGSSDPNSSNAPAWSVQLLDLSTVPLNQGVVYNMDNTIPQMSATLFIDYEQEEEGGFYNLVASDSIFLDVEEFNTVFKSNGNFDIEVFTSSSGGQMSSLGFINRQSDQSENLIRQTDPYLLSITINGNNEQINRNFPKLNEKYVEFYLDIATDQEISFVSDSTNSSLYKKNVDNTPQDPCDTLDSLPDGYDI
tara:strand:- start:398 stop:1294 length:897 start_codon:yes stop_codon:yes gene_type:complete